MEKFIVKIIGNQSVNQLVSQPVGEVMKIVNQLVSEILKIDGGWEI